MPQNHSQKMYFIVYVLLSTFGCLVATNFHTGEMAPPKFEYYGQVKKGAQDDQFSLANAHLQSHLKTGTTIVGICCRDGVVLGADTRSTGGPLVMDKNKLKIHTISQRIRCCAAGTSADCDQVTRKTSHHLGLVRIEQELSGENESIDLVQTAVTSISNTIQNSLASGGSRKVQSVMILGGVDAKGPALFQIDAEGVPQRIGFGALGSGATDALAILESARRQWTRKRKNNTTTTTASTTAPTIAIMEPSATHTFKPNVDILGSFRGADIDHSNYNHHNNDRHPLRSSGDSREDISVAEATEVVRKAVRAGILNDLGSGSHVDLCVITTHEVRQWREELVSSWDTDRPQSHKNPFVNSGSLSNDDLTTSSSDDRKGEHQQQKGKDGVDTLENAGTAAAEMSTATSTAALGRRVFSRLRPIRRLIGGTSQEIMSAGSVDDNLAFNVEQLTL